MKHKINRFLSIILALLLTLTYIDFNSLIVQAENKQTVKLDVQELKDIDVFLTTGRTSVNIDNFKPDLLKELENLGVDTNRVNIVAETTLADVTTTDFTWKRKWNCDYSINYWTPYSYLSNYQVGKFVQSGNNLVITGNSTSGGKQILWTEPAIGNSYYDDITFSYTLDFGDNITGCGVFVGGYIDEKTNKLTGYFLSFNAPYWNQNLPGFYAEDSHGCYSGYNYPAYWSPYCLYRLPVGCGHGYGAGTNSMRYKQWGDAAGGHSGALFKVEWDLAEGYMNTNDLRNHGHYTLLQGFDIPYYGTAHLVRNGDKLSIEIKKDKAHSQDSQNFPFTYVTYISDFEITDYGNLWGFFSEHYSHNCSAIGKFTLGNITLLQKYTLSYAEIIKGVPEWGENSVRCTVNINDYVEEDLADNTSFEYASTLATTLSENIHYIGWSTNENRTVNQGFVSANNNQGLVVESVDYNKAIKETAQYIKTLLVQESSSQYLLVDSANTVKANPSEYQTNTQTEEYPDGRWRIEHDDTKIDKTTPLANSLGKYDLAGVTVSDLPSSLSKPGLYEFYFEDKLIKVVYAHRKPIASIDMALTGTSLSLSSNSFDADVEKDIGYGKGISEIEWKYMIVGESNWIDGYPTTIDPEKNYVIQLKAKDYQDTWSEPATINVNKADEIKAPIAKFTITKANIVKNKETLEIIDNSYDPQGLDLIKYEWVLYNSKGVVIAGPSSTPITDFSSYPNGAYVYKLRVTNSKNLSSSYFQRTFNVTSDYDIYYDKGLTNDTTHTVISGATRNSNIQSLNILDRPYTNVIYNQNYTAPTIGNVRGRYYQIDFNLNLQDVSSDSVELTQASITGYLNSALSWKISGLAPDFPSEIIVYHSHKGNSTDGGGCYTVPIKHIHIDSCYYQPHTHNNNCYDIIYHAHLDADNMIQDKDYHASKSGNCFTNPVYKQHIHSGNQSVYGGCYTTAIYKKHTHSGNSTDGGGCYGEAVYHTHSGNSTNGGGCYTSPVYKKHYHSGNSTDGGGCYTIPYEDVTGCTSTTATYVGKVGQGYTYGADGFSQTIEDNMYRPVYKCDGCGELYLLHIGNGTAKISTSCVLKQDWSGCITCCSEDKAHNTNNVDFVVNIIGKTVTIPGGCKNTVKTTKYKIGCGKTAGTRYASEGIDYYSLNCKYKSYTSGQKVAGNIVSWKLNCGKTQGQRYSSECVDYYELGCNKTQGQRYSSEGVDYYSLSCDKTGTVESKQVICGKLDTKTLICTKTIEGYALGCGKTEQTIEERYGVTTTPKFGETVLKPNYY